MWLIYAAASAICFGTRGILYQWSSRMPVDRNLMLLGVFTFGTMFSLVANILAGQAWTWGALAGIMMGAFSFLSNMSMYRGFAVGKASLVAVFTSLPAAVVSISAYFLWHETLNGWQLGSLCVILLGIVIIRYSNELTLSNLRGVQWAILAMFGFAVTDLFSKQSQLWEAEVLPTLTMMFATGSLLFLVNYLREVYAHKQAPASAAASDSPVARWSGRRSFLWGMVVGITNVSGMMLILPAFSLGPTGLVSAVAATGVLIILLFTRFYLREQFTKPQLLGISLTIVGVMLLRLLG